MAKGRSIRVYINADMEKRLALWHTQHPKLNGCAASSVLQHCLMDVTDKLAKQPTSLDGYQVLIVNGSLTEIPTLETITSYKHTIRLASGDKKYIVGINTYSEFLEALVVLRDLVEAGTHTIISMSY